MTQDKKPHSSDLESRRSPDLSYGEDVARATREQARKPRANTAFYWIEREAIRLRRMRWQPEQQAACEKVDSLATSLAGTWERQPESRAMGSDEYRLAQHARPAERAERRSSTLMNGLRRWMDRDKRSKRGTS